VPEADSRKLKANGNLWAGTVARSYLMDAFISFSILKSWSVPYLLSSLITFLEIWLLCPYLQVMDDIIVSTQYWHKMEDGRLQCDLCPRLEYKF